MKKIKEVDDLALIECERCHKGKIGKDVCPYCLGDGLKVIHQEKYYVHENASRGIERHSQGRF